MRYEKENIYFVQMVRQAKKPVKTPKKECQKSKPK